MIGATQTRACVYATSPGALHPKSAATIKTRRNRSDRIAFRAVGENLTRTSQPTMMMIGFLEVSCYLECFCRTRKIKNTTVAQLPMSRSRGQNGVSPHFLQ